MTAKKLATKKIANMKNPFKFGTVVEDEFFTDRIEELQQVKQTLNSDNHRSLGDGFFTRLVISGLTTDRSVLEVRGKMSLP